MSEQAYESLAVVVSKDSHLDSLKALRDRLADSIDSCASLRDLAALSQRLMDVLKHISELDDAGAASSKETGLSDFEKRLRERESSPKNPRRAKGG